MCRETRETLFCFRTKVCGCSNSRPRADSRVQIWCARVSQPEMGAAQFICRKRSQMLPAVQSKCLISEWIWTRSLEPLYKRETLRQGDSTVIAGLRRWLEWEDRLYNTIKTQRQCTERTASPFSFFFMFILLDLPTACQLRVHFSRPTRL